MDTPTLVYDDDCGFCTYWVEYVAERSDLAVVGFSELSEDTLGLLPADYEDCAHLITEEQIFSCGEAMEEAFLMTGLGGELAEFVQFARGFEEYEKLRERTYSWVADNRGLLGQFVSSTPPARSGKEEA